MIGWKRIVVTVGEKIGKEHLTYAQGASAELVAMCTILAADNMNLPVSTTHVLSSGIAGTMAANRIGSANGHSPQPAVGVGPDAACQRAAGCRNLRLRTERGDSPRLEIARQSRDFSDQPVSSQLDA